MPASSQVEVAVDLRRIQQNAQNIAASTRVPVIAVVKADAYGLGAEAVSRALADVVDRFCVFGLGEAIALDAWRRLGKAMLAIGPLTSTNPQDYLDHHVQPAVSSIETAHLLRDAHPVLCVDTGQQRFACATQNVVEALDQGQIQEAFTHATSMDQVRILQQAVGSQPIRLHAAGSSLLNEPAAWLNAVRPGLAIYLGAVRVSTKLIETRKNQGPAGYSGFVVPFHGVIPVGYSNGLRPGPCQINGRPSKILEVGMQTAFVETCDSERPGDPVLLLGNGLTEQMIADAWRTSPHECLVRLTGAGPRTYVPAP